MMPKSAQTTVNHALPVHLSPATRGKSRPTRMFGTAVLYTEWTTVSSRLQIQLTPQALPWEARIPRSGHPGSKKVPSMSPSSMIPQAAPRAKRATQPFLQRAHSSCARMAPQP